MGHSECPLGGGGLTLGEIVSALAPHAWRRNTVHTYLTRMESKGLVSISREQEPHRYAAAVNREECARQERNRLLDRVYGGAAGDLIAAFLKESQITPRSGSACESSWMTWRCEMTNLWSFLLQTLSVTLAGALVLAVKALLKDKLTPRWQYFVWSVLALRLWLPVQTRGNYVLLPLPSGSRPVKTG